MSSSRSTFEAPTFARKHAPLAVDGSQGAPQCEHQSAPHSKEQQLVDAGTAPEVRTCNLCLGSNADSFFCAADGAPCWQSGEQHHWYCKHCLIGLCARRGPVCVGCRREFPCVMTIGDEAPDPVPREFCGERCGVCGSAQAVGLNVIIVCECADCANAPAPLRKAVHLYCTGHADGAHWPRVPTGKVFHIAHAPPQLGRQDRTFEDGTEPWAEERDGLEGVQEELRRVRVE